VLGRQHFLGVLDDDDAEVDADWEFAGFEDVGEDVGGGVGLAAEGKNFGYVLRRVMMDLVLPTDQ
jgi:hypothetical protein